MIVAHRFAGAAEDKAAVEEAVARFRASGLSWPEFDAAYTQFLALEAKANATDWLSSDRSRARAAADMVGVAAQLVEMSTHIEEMKRQNAEATEMRIQASVDRLGPLYEVHASSPWVAVLHRYDPGFFAAHQMVADIQRQVLSVRSTAELAPQVAAVDEAIRGYAAQLGGFIRVHDQIVQKAPGYTDPAEVRRLYDQGANWVFERLNAIIAPYQALQAAAAAYRQQVDAQKAAAAPSEPGEAASPTKFLLIAGGLAVGAALFLRR